MLERHQEGTYFIFYHRIHCEIDQRMFIRINEGDAVCQFYFIYPQIRHLSQRCQRCPYSTVSNDSISDFYGAKIGLSSFGVVAHAVTMDFSFNVTDDCHTINIHRCQLWFATGLFQEVHLFIILPTRTPNIPEVQVTNSPAALQ